MGPGKRLRRSFFTSNFTGQLKGQTIVGRKKSKNPADRADKPAADLKDRQAEFFRLFAQNLKATRQKKKLAQVELAYRAGLTRSYLNRVENEDDPLHCNLFAACRLAKALGVKLEKLCPAAEPKTD